MFFSGKSWKNLRAASSCNDLAHAASALVLSVAGGSATELKRTLSGASVATVTIINASVHNVSCSTIIVTGTVTPDPEFYPASLWCPQEDYFIWGQGAFDTSIVDEAAASGYEECAQRCSEFTNEAGNSPCFSWTMNSNAGEALGLAGGNCRLLAYMNVSGIAFPGVQSGFHKCWNAAQTLNP